MSQVLAWKSDTDGKLFEDKQKYIKHLKKLAADRLCKKAIQRAQETKEEFLKKMQAVNTVEELEKFIADNSRWFVANAMGYEWNATRNNLKYHTLFNVKFDLTYDQWRDGFTGHIKFSVKTEFIERGKITVGAFGNSYFKGTNIALATGGYSGSPGPGLTDYRYGVRLPFSYFPGLRVEYEQNQLWDMVKNPSQYDYDEDY